MPDLLPLAYVVAVPAALVLVAWLAWKAGEADADPDPILLPADDDDDGAHYAWVAEVQYDATGNYETFVIVDRGDDPSTRELRQTIQDRVPGAEVKRLDHHRLHVIGPDAPAISA